MSDGDESGNEGSASDEALSTVGDVAGGLGKVAGGVAGAAQGDAAATVGSLATGLGGAASALGDALPKGEAGEAIATVGKTTQAADQVLGAAQSLGGAAQRGVLGGAASALGGGTDASRYIVPDHQASEVLGGAGQAASALGQGAELRDGLGGILTGQRNDDVAFHLEVSETDGRWGLSSVSLTESLNDVPVCTLEAVYSSHVMPKELLHKSISVTIERQDQRRSFKGIVFHATVADRLEDTHVELRVAPAAALLGKHFNSHIFQDKTVPQVIQEVFDRRLGPMQRTLRDDTTRTYEVREYIVQYQESDLAFISRLAEEEGIFWYFDHEGDHEVFVLHDAMSGLPQARPDADGRVQYHGDPSQAPDGETAWELNHEEEIGTTDVVVADYDWTHPPLDVRGEETGRGEHEPALEVYDHVDALIFHKYNGYQYEGNTAALQAQLRAERLDLARQHWSMRTSVVTAAPAHTLELIGAPNGDLDQRYMIVSSSCRGSTTVGSTGSWDNMLEVVPASMPFRPERRTPRPVVHGPETATVVGPGGDDIHTDEHGRVRVHFHWDRVHAREAEDSSCWMRVAHNWAGPGFGTFFLPRIGMEVMVHFLAGNPDRPLVTGCIYNGHNASPATPLPDKKTQSVIRTRSSVNGDGFNELRFEDAMGEEFIYIHAEKDFNEEVENNHSTHVMNCQSNTVDVNQTETVGGNQTMTVHKNRTKTVDKDEENTIHENRNTTVDLNDTENVGGDRSLTVTGNETVTIKKNRELHVHYKTKQFHDKGREITVESYDQLTVSEGANRNVAVTGQYNNKVDGHYVVKQGGTETIYLNGHTYVSSASKIELHAPGCMIKMEGGKISIVADSEVSLSSGGSTVALKSDGTIEAKGGSKVAVDGGGAMGEWSSSGVKQTGNMVEIGADAIAKIVGTMVKIN